MDTMNIITDAQTRRRLADGIVFAVEHAYDRNFSALARAAGMPACRVHGYKLGVARVREGEVRALERVIRLALASSQAAPPASWDNEDRFMSLGPEPDSMDRQTLNLLIEECEDVLRRATRVLQIAKSL